MNKKFKKILISFILSAFLLVSQGASFAYAQSTWYSQSFEEFYTKVYDSDNPDEIFGERYTAAQVEWVIWGLTAMILNGLLGQELATCIFGHQTLFDCVRNLITKSDSGPSYANLNPNNENKGVNLVSSYLAHNNLSGVGYIVNRVNKLKGGLVPEVKAQAQGFGFSALGNSVRSLWTVTRNISYFLLVIAMIILAFMVMFRVKTSPQTAITVQSAIPRVIIALILITFSFAIAGFLIDLMYVVIGIVAAIFTQGGSNAVIVGEPGFTGSTWADTFSVLTEGIRTNVPMPPNIPTGVVLWFILWNIIFTAILASALNNLSTILTALGITGLISILLLFILGIIVLFLWLRTLWALILAFVRIILLIIAGPIYILAGTIMPGMGTGHWIRELASNLAIYPLVGILLLLSYVFLAAAEGELQQSLSALNAVMSYYTHLNFNLALFPAGQGWNPPLTFGIGNLTPFLYLGASLATIAIIPRTADIIKSLISGQGFAAGTAIGAALGVPAGWAWGQARGIAMTQGGERLAKWAAERAYIQGASGLEGFITRQIAGWGYRRGLIEKPSLPSRAVRRRGEL